MKAGSRGKNGKYPKGTLYHRVDERLSKMGEMLKKYGDEKSGRPKSKARSKGIKKELDNGN